MPDHAQAEDRLLRFDAVPADDGDARLSRLVGRPAQDVGKRFHGQLLIGKADEVERGQRFAAHGIDIAQGIGGRDGAEIVGPIDDGREKIGRQHKGQIVVELIDGGIVGGSAADQHVGIGDDRQLAEQGQQVARRLLGGAAGTFGKLRQANRLGGCHGAFLGNGECTTRGTALLSHPTKYDSYFSQAAWMRYSESRG